MAPLSIEYSQLGFLRWNRSSYAMSAIPFSVSVGISIDVPRKPVWRQLPCSLKLLRRRSVILALASPFTILFFRAKSAGVCMVLRISVLKVPSGLRNESIMY